MTAVAKIDANSTGLRICKEASLGVLPGAAVWRGLGPNSYKDFGADIKKVARKPINAGRQTQKGISVDLDASGGYQFDVTYDSMGALADGLFYATYRSKQDLAIASVDDATGYAPASGGNGYHAGDLLFASGFTNPVNNGLKIVTGSPTGTSVVAAGLADETGSSGKITRVGVQCTAADITVDVSGTYPALKATAFDFTTLGVIPGEWIYIGGDAAANAFANAVNNGYARVKAVAAKTLTLDKTAAVMAADTGAGKTIRLFVGRVVKNEADPAMQVRSTYSLERTLGAPDDASPNQQAEYLQGSGLNEFVLTLNTADKITAEMSLISAGYSTRSAAEGLLPGTRPAIVERDAYNTTSHVKRATLHILGQTSSVYAYASVAALTISNNLKPSKAIGVFGAFDFVAGTFDVSATVTAYFTDVAALAAIRNNADVSMEIIVANDNSGIVFDMPLVSLGGGRLNIAGDEAITVPLTITAASGAKVDPNMDHTLLAVFFDYLPNRAM